MADEVALVRKIDALIRAPAGDLEFALQSDDYEFLRRVYLDLAGRIPTAGETRTFVGDAAADKREKLIDRLLTGPDFPRRMQELFHSMLMERRAEHEEWTRFLRIAFEQNLAWNEIARQLIRPDAADASRRGAAFFQTSRLVKEGAMSAVDVPGLTRDVARLLAGVDLQCAQCHDHLTVDDYSQQDFQGLHMIFENVQTRRDVKFPAVSEKVMLKKKEFRSVFDQIAKETGPFVPGAGEVEIATFAKGEEFAVPPDNKTRKPGVPKFSPLVRLADGLASPENELFRRNIVNRLWFVMMGRGIVEPLDLHHSSNPPTHPELLDLLSREFAANGFNIRWMLRELAMTETYQRTSVLADFDNPPPRASYAVGIEKRLSAEQIFWSALIATGEFDVERPAPTVEEEPDTESSETATDAESNEAEPVPEIVSTAYERAIDESEELAALQQLFLKAFANPPKEPEIDFEPTVKAALFVMHDEKFLSLVAARKGNLIDRLSRIEDSRALVDELFVNVLSRTPTDDDRTDIVAFLKANSDDRTHAIGQIVWALLASTEFCVNH